MNQELSLEERALLDFLKKVWTAKVFVLVFALVFAATAYILTKKNMPVHYKSKVAVEVDDIAGFPFSTEDFAVKFGDLLSSYSNNRSTLTETISQTAPKSHPIFDVVIKAKVTPSQLFQLDQIDQQLYCFFVLPTKHDTDHIESLQLLLNTIIEKHNSSVFSQIDNVLGKETPRNWSNVILEKYLLSELVGRYKKQGLPKIKESSFGNRSLDKSLIDSLLVSMVHLPQVIYFEELQWLTQWQQIFTKVKPTIYFRRGYELKEYDVNTVVFPKLKFGVISEESKVWSGNRGSGAKRKLILALSTVLGMFGGYFAFRIVGISREIRDS